MRREDLTARQLAAIWWAILWRGALAGLIGGFLIGFVEGFILAIVGLREIGTVVSTVSGLAFGFVAGAWAVREALAKPYNDFEIIIRPKTAPAVKQTTT